MKTSLYCQRFRILVSKPHSKLKSYQHTKIIQPLNTDLLNGYFYEKSWNELSRMIENGKSYNKR